MSDNRGWHYFVMDDVEVTGKPPKEYQVFTSLEEARAAQKPGQLIWRGPQSGGTLELVEQPDVK
jgi:hypothetical protein